MIRTLLAAVLLSAVVACGQQVSLQGHALRVFPVDQQDTSWITQDDIHEIEKTVESSGQAVLRLHLKPEAAQRLLTLTSANIGATVRFTWDGKVVSDMRVAAPFGRVVNLPAPPA